MAEEWELRLWTDTDVDAFGLENRDVYEAAGNFGQKSDILRYEVRIRKPRFLSAFVSYGVHRTYLHSIFFVVLYSAPFVPLRVRILGQRL